MEIGIVHGDLFKAPKECFLCHCISSDFAMGAGIAREFSNRGIKAQLLSEYKTLDFNGYGYAIFTPMEKTAGVYNLITKKFYFNKPTYDTLRGALISMRDQLVERTHDKPCKLAMPKIASGLDRLDWDKVKEIIEEVFADTNVSITVYEY